MIEFLYTQHSYALICVLLALALLASIEAGFFIGRWKARRRSEAGKKPQEITIATTLSVLALVLAFTFSLAVDLYSQRKAMVIEEVNAISTAYARADYLPLPYSHELQSLLREYLGTRNESIRAMDIERILTESKRLQELIWQKTSSLAKRYPNSVAAGLFIQSINEVIDCHEKRVILGLYSHIPTPMWVVLLLLSNIGMASLGYACGAKRSTRDNASYAFAFTLCLVLLLIFDLDKPSRGLIRTNQQPSFDLEAQIQK